MAYGIILLALMLGIKSKKTREKLSSFECGFDPMTKVRAPFSLKFFLITIIFLIFDVEIALLLPLGVVIDSLSYIYLRVTCLFIILILIVGLFHEWNEGALD